MCTNVHITCLQISALSSLQVLFLLIPLGDWIENARWPFFGLCTTFLSTRKRTELLSIYYESSSRVILHQGRSSFSWSLSQSNPNIWGNGGLPNRYSTERNLWVSLIYFWADSAKFVSAVVWNKSLQWLPFRTCSSVESGIWLLRQLAVILNLNAVCFKQVIKRRATFPYTSGTLQLPNYRP